MTSDAALLVLIVDDDQSLRILGAWGALECKLADIEDGETLARLAEISSVGPTQVKSKLQRLLAARVIIDGGISDLADKLLQSTVQSRIGGTKKKR